MLRSRIDWKISSEEIHTIRSFVRTCESAFRVDLKAPANSPRMAMIAKEKTPIAIATSTNVNERLFRGAQLL